jgi:hypothetical protein
MNLWLIMLIIGGCSALAAWVLGDAIWAMKWTT